MNTVPTAPSADEATLAPVWDEDLRIARRLLPAAWLYGFYLSCIVAIAYWIFYPAWPLGSGFTPGIATVSFSDSAGRTVTRPWNSRAVFLEQEQAAAAALRAFTDRLERLTYAEIEADFTLQRVAMAAGKSLFTTHCRACHPMAKLMQQTTVFPKNCPACHQHNTVRLPRTVDPSKARWIYGGRYETILETIRHGRRGYMPPYREVLSFSEREALAHYVLSLSGIATDATKTQQGRILFHAETAACHYCHGSDGKGRQDIGAANLTDQIWLWTEVPGQPNLQAQVSAIHEVIDRGLNHDGMPAWENRLSPLQIKLLALYIHALAGGT